MLAHSAPGFMFSQPARRPGPSPHPTRQPRTLRHQTNSFSFDDSERSSVAYEQERALSASTTDSRPRPTETLNLRQELRGSSLQSSRIPSFTSSSRSELPPGYEGIPTQTEDIELEMNFNWDVRDSDISHPSRALKTEQSLITTSIQIHHSPELDLPPPFSTVSRSVSVAGSLPSSPPDGYSSKPSPSNLPKSASASYIGSPSRNISISSSVISQLIREHDERQASSPPVSHTLFLNFVSTDFVR